MGIRLGPILAIVLLTGCQEGPSGSSSRLDDAGGAGPRDGSPGAPPANVPPLPRDAAPQPFVPQPAPPAASTMDAGDAAPSDALPMENPPFAMEPDSPATQSNPDAFTKARLIGPGGQADIAIDPARRVVHLIYVHGDSILYRLGTLQGAFQEPEVIAQGVAWNYPRIVLDKDGAPHVTFADLVDAFYHGKSNYYTNRIGGRWKPLLKVFDIAEDNAPWANVPTLAIDSDLTVFMGTKLEDPVPSRIVRIENVAEAPRVALKSDIFLSAMNLVMSEGRLVAVGYREGGFRLYMVDKTTLKFMGEGITFGDGVKAEQCRAYADHRDDVHIAFANGQPAESRGYYTSLKRLEAKQPAIRYATSNRHHSGNGRGARDHVAADRVYVFHWSGASGDGVFPRCEPANRIHFVRVEEGRKVQELRPITDRPGGHGPSFRMQPAVASHPNGGVIVVFNECTPGTETTLWTESSLWFTRVGAYGN